MQLQAEQREALGAIAQYAEQMNIAEGDTERAKAAVDLLQQAVAALKQIVTVLETAKLFWEMMARACRRLASTEIKEYIALFAEMSLKTAWPSIRTRISSCRCYNSRRAGVPSV